MTLSRPFKEDRLALPLTMPLSSMRSMCDALAFVPAGSVSPASRLYYKSRLVATGVFARTVRSVSQIDSVDKVRFCSVFLPDGSQK